MESVLLFLVLIVVSFFDFDNLVLFRGELRILGELADIGDTDLSDVALTCIGF